MDSFRRFTKLAAVSTVYDWVVRRANVAFATATSQKVPLQQAHGRTLAESIVASVNLPPFRRAMMDGIAIRFVDLHPDTCWTLVAKSDPVGQESKGSKPAIQTLTGSPLSDPWDTVVPIERLMDVGGNRIDDLPLGTQIRVDSLSLKQGSNVATVGEDVQAGECLFSAGRRVRIQDIGLLAALGFENVDCKHRPKVEILVTGDELTSRDRDYWIHDANGPALEAFVQRDGGDLVQRTCIEDDRNKIEKAILGSHADLLLVSGGTSVGPQDHSADIVSQNGQLHFHGIDIRPGKPMGVGEIGGKVIYLLPGNPVACQFSYELLTRPFLQIAAGGNPYWPYSQTTKKLSADVVSKVGRVDYLRVKFDGPNAEPLTSGRGSHLSSVTRADGFVIVPAEAQSLTANSFVDVLLYDESKSAMT